MTPPLTVAPSSSSRLACRAQEILRESRRRIYARTDRMFAVVMLLQWAGTMIAAACLPPTTWDGDAGRLHPHINLAVFFGGAVCALPLLLAWRRPGADVTRYVIVIGQVVFSSIIIHVTGGRIESHFHVFGSLALIAAYRDWRLFVPAVGIIAADHFIRGQFWPETVYGVFTASPWRTVEHSGWVLFETIFLIYSIRLSAREMRLKALQTAHLEQSHADLQSSAEQLARSFDKERAIIDGALDAIVQMDADGVVTSWNSQAERQFGWRIAEALGRPAAELILPPRGRAEFLASIESYRTSGQAPLLGCRVEIEGQRRAGEAFPMEMAVAPIRRGDETLYCAFLRDITARRQYEENQPLQERLPGQHEPRNSHAAQRHSRVHRVAYPQRRRGQRSGAPRLHPHHPLQRAASAGADQQHPRPLED